MASMPRGLSSFPLPVPDRPSIAVLPFANLSGEAHEEYFSDGITDDIITELSRISELFVVARNSSFQFKGKAVDVRKVGCELGVRNVLEGCVRRVGNKVRINAQLIDCSTGGHIWAERFDRKITDIFKVQDEITQNVVAALSIKLTEGTRWGHGYEATTNLEAYDCFLRGREQRIQFTFQSIANAEVALKRAIRLDPNFAPAYAFLADCYIVRFINGWGDNGGQLLSEAYALAKKAVAFDPDYGRAHIFLGHAYLLKKQHAEALTAMRKSLALEPNSSRGHVWLGRVLHYAGRSKDAVAPIKLGLRLDPFHHANFLHWLAQAFFQLRCYEEAVELLRRRLIRTPDSDDSHVLLASAYGHLGRASKARDHWRKALGINPGYSLDHQRRVMPYKNPLDFAHIVHGLDRAGLT
jgi:TolB-like protein/Tfp pilus assembly protein PilF